MSRDRWYVNNLTTEACFLVQAQFTKEEAIEEITRRLVEYYQPERIYLFGSVARGDDGRDSDLDFCAVVPDEIPAEKLPGGEVYSFVSGTGHERISCIGAVRISICAHRTLWHPCLPKRFANGDYFMMPDDSLVRLHSGQF